MRSVEVEVLNASGLHARPAAAFVRAAIGFSVAIRVENVTTARPAANAKSLVGVLSCGVERGHHVRISAEGSDGALVLAGLGVDELSADASSLDGIRAALAGVTDGELRDLARRALGETDAETVRTLAGELLDRTR